LRHETQRQAIHGGQSTILVPAYGTHKVEQHQCGDPLLSFLRKQESRIDKACNVHPILHILSTNPPLCYLDRSPRFCFHKKVRGRSGEIWPSNYNPDSCRHENAESTKKMSFPRKRESTRYTRYLIRSTKLYPQFLHAIRYQLYATRCPQLPNSPINKFSN